MPPIMPRAPPLTSADFHATTALVTSERLRLYHYWCCHSIRTSARTTVGRPSVYLRTRASAFASLTRASRKKEICRRKRPAYTCNKHAYSLANEHPGGVMQQLKSANCLGIAVLLMSLGLLTSSVAAQESAKLGPKEVSITASVGASSDRVRIAGPATVVQMRIEIYATSGIKLLDDEIRGGNVFDWYLQDSRAQRLSAGEYVCVVTV